MDTSTTSPEQPGPGRAEGGGQDPASLLARVARKSAGLLAFTSSGSTTPVLADGVLRGDRLGITVEPAGGTHQPTSTPVVVMRVA
jgi:hypothetical protein